MQIGVLPLAVVQKNGDNSAVLMNMCVGRLVLVLIENSCPQPCPVQYGCDVTMSSTSSWGTLVGAA